MTRLADLKQQFQALAATLTFDSLDQECDLTVAHGDKRLIATWENALKRLQMYADSRRDEAQPTTEAEEESIDVQTAAEPTAPVCEQSEPKGNMSSSRRLTILKVKQMIRELFETDEDYKRWLYLGSVGDRRLLKPWVNFYIRTQKLISMAGSNALSAIREADGKLSDRELSDAKLRIAVRDAVLSEEALALATEAIEEEHQCAAEASRAETSNDEIVTTPDKETKEYAKPSVPRRVQRRAAAFFRNLIRGASEDGCNRIPFYAQPYDLRGAIQRKPMQVHFRHTEEGNSLHKVSAVM
jgi:hypothetical protein